MPSQEQGVALQTDQLQPVPGGGVRTVTVMVPINGVPTPMQMQVVCIADANGVIADAPYLPREVVSDIINVLKDIRVMLAKLSDTPFTDSQLSQVNNPGILNT